MAVRITRMRGSLRRAALGGVVAVLALGLSIVGDVRAEPGADALARLNELSRQAVQSRAAVTAAQFDLEAKLAEQAAAEERHRADLVALEAADAQLRSRQAAVGDIAAMMYVGGRTDGLSAVLTADSPQQLIDQLTVERAVAAELADQMKAFVSSRELTEGAARASEVSATDARAAAEHAATVRADLEAKWSELRRQIAAAEAQYAALTPNQREAFDNQPPPAAPPLAPPPPNAPPPPIAPPQPDPAIAPPQPPPAEIVSPMAAVRPEIPEALPVGVAREAGLQPNTIVAARAISARFPEIRSIDGVRPDPKPWHPNGLAIDVMIPNPMSAAGIALGNEILEFVLSNAGRFGLQDVIWRGTYYTPSGPQGSGYGHYDHVHVTTTPSR